MNADVLKNILDEHEVWITSLRESGSRADLCGANLCGANLCDASLCGASLCGASLCGASLCGASLCDANLCDANLCGANLCDASLCGANLCDASLPDRTFVIMGEPYYLQITNGEYVKAGCQNHTAEQWRKFSKREIAEMDGKKALKFYPRLLKIIDFYVSEGDHPEWLKEPEADQE
ncbi:pentapeptide repeat-containing protein [Pectobacterium carotovorum]|uniref:pentapeptide repeat-containing protein n=1 Tax=Pectobacterium carotovorum TaxID=554 RepID=UPI003017D094